MTARARSAVGCIRCCKGFIQYHAVPGDVRRLWSLYRLLHCWWRILRRLGVEGRPCRN